MLIRCLEREFRLCFYSRQSLCNALLFLLVIVALFPIAISPEPKVLQRIGPGVIWVCALLTMLLSMQKLFQDDYRDGSLDYLLMASQSLTDYILAKVIVCWLWLSMPIIILTPFIALLYQLTVHTVVILMLSLLLGTPSLMLIAALLSALTVTFQQNSILVLLMALPLYVPILIFSAAAPFSIASWPIAIFSFLSAILMLTITVLPLITAKILQYAVQQ